MTVRLPGTELYWGQSKDTWGQSKILVIVVGSRVWSNFTLTPAFLIL